VSRLAVLGCFGRSTLEPLRLSSLVGGLGSLDPGGELWKAIVFGRKLSRCQRASSSIADGVRHSQGNLMRRHGWWTRS